MGTPAELTVSAVIIPGSIFVHAQVTKNSGRYEFIQGSLLGTYMGEILEYDRVHREWSRALNPSPPTPPFQ